GGDLVTVRELHALAELEGPGLAVCRDVRHASGSVRDDLQVVVELVQAGEDLGQECDVDRGVYVRRVEARRVVDDGEPQGLVGGKGLRGRATSAAAGRDQRDCSQRAGEGTEQSASRHTTSYETRLEEGAHIRNFAFPESIALFPVARGESAPATDRGHLPDGPATPSSVLNFASPKSSFRANLALRRAKSGPKRLPGLVLQDPKARPVVVVKRVAARTLQVRMHQVLLHAVEQATED